MRLSRQFDNYNLPLIIAYVDYQVILYPAQLSRYWPNALYKRIANAQGSMIHIPFAQAPILNALTWFTVNGVQLNGVLNYYHADAHREWGLLYPKSAETNYLKS